MQTSMRSRLLTSVPRRAHPCPQECSFGQLFPWQPPVSAEHRAGRVQQPLNHHWAHPVGIRSQGSCLL